MKKKIRKTILAVENFVLTLIACVIATIALPFFVAAHTFKSPHDDFESIIVDIFD